MVLGCRQDGTIYYLATISPVHTPVQVLRDDLICPSLTGEPAWARSKAFYTSSRYLVESSVLPDPDKHKKERKDSLLDDDSGKKGSSNQ